MLGSTNQIELLFDNIRHLSRRSLCMQQYVREKLLEAAAVPTKWNGSDLCAKKLSKDRMHFLMNMAGAFDSKVDEPGWYINDGPKDL